jgi:thioredoxin-like negative regulator of GroEL
MIIANSNELIKELISNNHIVLLYFGSNTCNVCTAIKPKIEELLKHYPEIKSAYIDAEKSLEISSAYSIFTIPAVLLYIEGKETIREARHIGMQDINNKIERYYNMLFDQKI